MRSVIDGPLYPQTGSEEFVGTEIGRQCEDDAERGRGIGGVRRFVSLSLHVFRSRKQFGQPVALPCRSMRRTVIVYEMTSFDVCIRDARLLDGRLLDISCTGSSISAIGPGLDAGTATVVRAGGALVTRPFAEPHLHLDKAGTADRVPRGAASISEAIAVMRAVKQTEQHDQDATIARMRTVTNTLVDGGSAAIRALVDVDDTWGLSAFRAARRVQTEFRDRAAIRIAIFPQDGLSARVVDLMAQAAHDGADVIGAHTDVDDDPAAHVRTAANIATAYGLPLEIHTDEVASPEGFHLPAVLDELDRHPALSVTLAHCLALGTLAEPEQHRWIAALADRGIAVCVAPSVMTFGLPIAPVRALIEGGVTVLVGSDNLQDVFCPLGTGRAVENARVVATAAGLTTSELVAPLIAGITDAAYQTVTGTTGQIIVGSPATLIVHNAKSPFELLWGVDGTKFKLTDGIVG